MCRRLQRTAWVLKKSITKTDGTHATIFGHELFEGIFDSSANGLILLDSEFHMLRVGKGLCQLLGYAPHELFAKSIRQIIAADNWSAASKKLTVLTPVQEKSLQVECRYLHKNGTIVWVIVAVSHLPKKAMPAMPQYLLQVTSIDKQKQAEELTEEALNRWNFALDSAGQGVWDCDVLTDTWSYSSSWKKMRGIPEDESILLDDENWIKEIHPDDHQLVLEKMAERFRVGMSEVSYEYRQRHRHGYWMWILARGRCTEFFPDGKPKRIIGTDTDITEIRRREVELADVSHRLEMALSTSQVGIWKYDVYNSATYWDLRTREIFGLPPGDEALPPQTWENSIHPEDRERVVTVCKQAVLSRQDFSMDYRIILNDGTLKHVRARASFPKSDTGPETMIGVNWDITADIAKAEAFKMAKLLAENKSFDLEIARGHLEHSSLHDSLTGLPNRRHLDKALLEFQNPSGKNQSLSLLHIDLDRFKQINDTKGHAAGDAVLVYMANLLRKQFRASDLVARIGGDEFVVLLSPSPEHAQLRGMVDRLIGLAREPINWQGHECRCGISIGIAEAAGDFDPRQLFVNADIALYRAKNTGRNCAIYFTARLQAEVIAEKENADDILKGIERQEFIPFYQPIFHTKTLDIAGVEALARWRHPVRGLLAPDTFLTVAAEFNLMNAIDSAILAQALCHLQMWDDAGIEIPRISVNVSARRLGSDSLLESLNALPIQPGRVSFELLESIFLDEFDDVNAKNISGIKNLGIGIDVDDFGTGHASIISLLRLHPNRMKIDRQLTRNIVESPSQRQLVKSLIEIGLSQNIEVCAEGVETAEHARILTELGCDYLQGYHFAKPMSETDFLIYMQGQSWKKDLPLLEHDGVTGKTLSDFMEKVGLSKAS